METQQNPKKAMWLSLIPGLGQIYNKQKAKGYIFLGVTLVFLAYFFGIGLEELSKLITLGTVRGKDNSLFILIRGAFHLIITVVYLMFYFEYLPFCLYICIGLDLDLGLGSFYSSNRSWYPNGYYCQPTIH